MRLIHVYWFGRFGPQESWGFVQCEMSAIPLRVRTGVGWDVVSEPVVPEGFITNPTGAATYKGLRKGRARCSR